MKRVLLTLGAGGFGALILAAMLPPDTVIGAAILCLTASLLAFCLPTVRRHSRAYGAGLLAAGVALCLFAKKELSDYRPAVARAGASVWIEATITEPPVVADEQLFCEVRVLSGDLKPGTRLAYGMPWDDEAPAIGDTVTGTVWLGVTESAETDPTACFGDKASGVYLTAWQQRKGAVTVRFADPGGTSASSAGEPLGVFLRAFRQRAQTGLTAAMPEDARALVSAICLGDRAELSDTVTEAFRRSGVSHLLVVSGLHVSLVALGAYTLLRRMRCRKRIAAVAALATLVLFGSLIGWRASVVRACVLLAAVLLGRCFCRPADSLNSLGGGLLVLWLHDPFCVYDLGLWLSFGATAGLILLYPWLWKRVSGRLPETGFRSRAARVCFPFIRSAVRVVCITLAATLPTLPLTACFFGDISLIAPLTNLLTVWAAAALLYLACATLLLSALGLSVLVSALSVPMTAIARFLTWVTRALSGVWGAVWNTRNLYIQVWIIGGLLLLWLGWRLCKGRGLRIAAAMCVIALCAGTLLYTVRMQGVTTLVAYNRYGQTAVAALRDGHAIVIVSGRRQSWKSAARLLDGQGVSAVDAVIITDPACFSADEWAAFDARLEVGRYWLTELEPDAAACLMNGGAPVSVAAWNGEQSVSLWQDGAWRWVRTSGILLFRFGETRLRIGNRAFFDDDPDDSENSAARRMLSVSMADRVTGQCDDTPYPGQRQVWYTHGQGVWVR